MESLFEFKGRTCDTKLFENGFEDIYLFLWRNLWKQVSRINICQLLVEGGRNILIECMFGLDDEFNIFLCLSFALITNRMSEISDVES